MLNQAETFLDQLARGATAVVRQVAGGRGLANKLAGLGIAAGCRIEVLQNPSRGPLLVRVRGTRVALGRGEAAKIRVERTAGSGTDAGD